MMVPDGSLERARGGAARLFRGSAALAAGVSLAGLAYSYGIVFGRPSTTGGAGEIAWNVALFTSFALHHSVCARTPVRRWIARAMPDAERSAFVWAASLLLALLCVLWEPVAGSLWRVTGPGWWLLLAIRLGGLGLIAWALALVGLRELVGLAAPLPGVHAPPTERGPYAWVRHPLYVGWLLLVFGVAHMTATRAVFAVVSALYVAAAIPLEEATLRHTLGDGYRRYAGRVRWRLLPGLFILCAAIVGRPAP